MTCQSENRRSGVGPDCGGFIAQIAQGIYVDADDEPDALLKAAKTRFEIIAATVFNKYVTGDFSRPPAEDRDNAGS